MKTMKLEFVVFNISQENAVFMWKLITRCIEFLGFDVTGKVEEFSEIFLDADDIDWSDPKSYYSNEDEHDD